MPTGSPRFARLSRLPRSAAGIRPGIAALLLAFAGAAVAGTTPVIVGAEPAGGSTSTLNLQTSQGVGCAAPVVGLCGSCSVSCPSGSAAYCKPGLAVGGQASASCLQPPECRCDAPK